MENPPGSSPGEGFHHYLPITDELLHSGFYVTSLGRAVIAPGEGYPPRTHPSLYDFSWEKGRTLPEFSLMLITCGEGIFETRRTGKVRLEGGVAVLLFPGVWHRYRPCRAIGWTEKWVHFNGEFPHKLMDQGIISSERPVLASGDFQYVETALDRLLAAAHSNPASNSLQISLLALGALAAAFGDAPAPAAPVTAFHAEEKGADPIAAAAIDYIWTRSHKVLSVQDVAENVGMTRRTLERHMTATIGHSVLDEIVQCRFSRAERLLRETDLPIKTIVALAGFGSVQNLRYVFLGRAGCAPGEYRERHRSYFRMLEIPAASR